MKLSPKEVETLFGLSRRRLRALERAGRIRPERTEGGHRRYDLGQIADAVMELEDQPPGGELGGSGLTLDVIRLWEDRVAELRTSNRFKIYREMRENDPILSAIFLAIESAILQARWRVEPAGNTEGDRQAAEFLESCQHDMVFSWGQTVHFALQMLEQGFAILEIVYKRRTPENSKYPDGRIGWLKLAPRPAETIAEWKLGPSGELEGIVQALPDGRTVEIPAEKLIHFRTTAAPANEPEGRPIHRAAYAPWWYTQQLQEIEGIGVERDLAGLPVVYLGEDCTLFGENSDYQQAVRLVERLRRDEQAGVVLPKPKMGEASPGTGILLELLSTGGRRQHDTSAIIERYDMRKALATLGQFILLGLVQRVGSFALAKMQVGLFTLAVSAWLETIAEAINQQAVPRLFRYNAFPGMTGLPKLVAVPSGLFQLEELADFVSRLAIARAITADEGLERYLRQLAKLPEPTEETTVMRKVDPEQASILLRRAALAARAAERLGAMTSEEAAELIRHPLNTFIDAMRRLGQTAPAEEEDEEET